MSAVETIEAAGPALQGLTRITELPGAALPVEECRWTPDLAPANMHLLLLLGELCGRCELSGGGGYSDHGTPENWLRLCDVNEAAVEAVLRRVERSYPSWHLDAGTATTTIDKVDCHFATAQASRRREG